MGTKFNMDMQLHVINWLHEISYSVQCPLRKGRWAHVNVKLHFFFQVIHLSHRLLLDLWGVFLCYHDSAQVSNYFFGDEKKVQTCKVAALDVCFEWHRVVQNKYCSVQKGGVALMKHVHYDATLCQKSKCVPIFILASAISAYRHFFFNISYWQCPKPLVGIRQTQNIVRVPLWFNMTFQDAWRLFLESAAVLEICDGLHNILGYSTLE